jgi:hypothetical protein
MPQQIEVRDSSGKLLGYFIPAEPDVDYAEVKKLFDPEEIKRRKERSRGVPGQTLDQIMDRIRSREKDS